MIAKSDLFFNDIKLIFSEYGASEWRAASEYPATMREFVVTNNLLDLHDTHLQDYPDLSDKEDSLRVSV
jgi:hypothetical protein